MCCVIKMPGQSEGICSKNDLIASVPPVDAPIISSFSLLISGFLNIAGAAPFTPPFAIRCSEATLALDAIRIFSAIKSEYSRMPCAMAVLGLVTKSVAPSSKARMVISEPRSVSVETITTGIGRKRINFSKKSSPSILGISTSKVSTSGFNCLIISLATNGSGAAPTTSISFCSLIISVNKLRIKAESSMTNTLVFILFFSCHIVHTKTNQFHHPHHWF